MIRLLLLGNVDLVGENGASADAALRRSKRVALLAYLAVARPRGFHRRDKIAALFWPEVSSDRARGALRTALARLREDHDADLVIRRGANDIAADTSLLACDVLDFDAALEAARFEDAVALHRGQFLDGLHIDGVGEELESWISSERSRLRDGLLRALAALTDSAATRRDFAGAVQYAQHALDVSPNDEPIARRLIEMLIASGNRGAAMRVYTELAQRLRSEFDVAPAAATSTLVAGLRAPAEIAPSIAVVQDVQRPVAEASAAAPPARRRRWYGIAAAAAVIGVGGVAWIATQARSAHTPAPAAKWRSITPIGAIPHGSFGGRAVLDSTGEALLAFSGVMDADRRVIASTGEYWRLRGLATGEGPSWTRITPAAGPHPSSRWLFGLSSDAAHDRVIMHAGALGFTSPCANDTWILNRASAIGHESSWQRVRVRGKPVPKRADFDQVFDARRGRLIVFGGHDCFYPLFQDTWVLAFDDSTLSSGEWSALTPDSSAGLPMHRDAYTSAYDTVAERLFIFGGRASTVPTSEIWSLDHAAGVGGRPVWRPIRCAGDAPLIALPASIMNFERDDWVVFGGLDVRGQVNGSVWRVHGLLRDVPHCRWEQLSPSEPAPAGRYRASAAMLGRGGDIVVFGGAFQNSPLSDAWVLEPSRR